MTQQHSYNNLETPAGAVSRLPTAGVSPFLPPLIQYPILPGHVPAPTLSRNTASVTPKKVNVRAKPFKLARDVRKLLGERVNMNMYQWQHRGQKERPIVSGAKINRHFAAIHAELERALGADVATDTFGFLPKITALQVQKSLDGDVQLYLRSNHSTGYFMVRSDADQHKGETDGLAATEWLAKTYNLPLFVTATPHGFSNTFWVRVPTRTIITPAGYENEVPCVGHREVNKMLREIDAGIGQLMKNAGFSCGFEFFGSSLEARGQYDENNVPVTARRFDPKIDLCNLCRLPPITTHEQLEEWKAAEITIGQLTKLHADCKALIPAEPKRKSVTSTPKADELERTQGDGQVSGDDDGETHEGADPVDSRNRQINKLRCLFAARKELGITTLAQLEQYEEQVIEAANAMYVRLGFGDSDFDARRRRKFDSAFKFMVRTWVDGVCGSRPGYFGSDDLKRINENFRSSISNNDVRDLLKGLDKDNSVHSYDIVLQAASVVAATIAKDANLEGEVSTKRLGKFNTNKLEVPNLAIVRMLIHFGLPSNRRFVARLKKLVAQKTKSVQEIYHGSKNNGCSRFHVNKPELFTFNEIWLDGVVAPYIEFMAPANQGHVVAVHKVEVSKVESVNIDVDILPPGGQSLCRTAATQFDLEGPNLDSPCLGTMYRDFSNGLAEPDAVNFDLEPGSYLSSSPEIEENEVCELV